MFDLLLYVKMYKKVSCFANNIAHCKHSNVTIKQYFRLYIPNSTQVLVVNYFAKIGIINTDIKI